ncbi:MAG: hypothetical protein VW935_18585, partial [Novosphingobium sp.]
RNHADVDKLEQSQIRLLLEHLTSKSLASCNRGQQAMYAEHSAAGRLRSGATVKRAVKICEDEGSAFITETIDQVGKVSKSPDAFDMIVSHLTAQTRTWDAHVSEAVRMATMGGAERFDSVRRAADDLLADLKTRMFRELEIHRFSFARSSPILEPKPFLVVQSSPDKPKNKGGKPLAAHWDAMWADIAVQLYVGDLKPKSQKQIKDAMFAWFNANSINAGDTAVTERARELWHKIEAAQ